MIFLLLYGCLCIWFAKVNAKWIQQEKRIKHGLNGLGHLIICGLFFYFYGVISAIQSLLVARVCFDWALNLYRGLPIDYVPKKPKSIVDKIEKVVFLENGLLAKILYILTFLCIQSLK